MPRWPTSADGKWYWKANTSSGELDGHYFFYATYYALVAKLYEGQGTGNHPDDEMAFLNYYNLLKYEKDSRLPPRRYRAPRGRAPRGSLEPAPRTPKPGLVPD